ncbi:uncharacterized protein LACBIDRAFT_312783 [Laccaria bicolor S238N-H82]|uniref:Predicted protein n=1 Tax=Laccaria bicolor (strain S238N-H82 / ATCC MYA-4686) TaxID=486041 RepID=B0DWP5_LACBS|nr:uncharacterized protein LACBIDRAFT_312783 [Laccaria bicolor S238N-H82]EDR01018.1 predicted protein [Laccaria bicolor S238N-H82]|eukprot:XP_001888413.1 predicted protein [Laccaria bicolor S238N-H82]
MHTVQDWFILPGQKASWLSPIIARYTTCVSLSLFVCKDITAIYLPNHLSTHAQCACPYPRRPQPNTKIRHTDGFKTVVTFNNMGIYIDYIK